MLVAGYLIAVFWASVFAPAGGVAADRALPDLGTRSVTGWWTVAGVLGAVVGLVAFGAVADVGNRFAAAADVVFLPCALAAGAVLGPAGDQRSRARDVVARSGPALAVGEGHGVRRPTRRRDHDLRRLRTHGAGGDGDMAAIPGRASGPSPPGRRTSR